MSVKCICIKCDSTEEVEATLNHMLSQPNVGDILSSSQSIIQTEEGIEILTMVLYQEVQRPNRSRER